MYLDGNSYHALLHPQENWVHTMGGEGRPIYLARRTTETRVWLPLARNPQDTMLDDTLSVITHRSILPSFETQPNIVPDLSPWQRKGGGGSHAPEERRGRIWDGQVASCSPQAESWEEESLSSCLSNCESLELSLIHQPSAWCLYTFFFSCVLKIVVKYT